MPYLVEITYGTDLYGADDERFEYDTVEEAAQRYENEALTENQPLSQIVEELGWEGLRLESFDPETRKRVVVGELEGALA